MGRQLLSLLLGLLFVLGFSYFVSFAAVIAFSSMFGDAEAGIFRSGETPEERRARLERYRSLEAASVPGIHPEREEWRFRTPWELYAALEKLLEVKERALDLEGIKKKLSPSFHYEEMEWMTTASCINDQGETSTDASSGTLRLLVRASSWAGTLERRYRMREDRFSTERCEYYVRAPELEYEFFDQDFSLLDSVIAEAGGDPIFDRPVLLGLMDAYSGEKVEWIALSWDGDMLPQTAAGTPQAPGSLGEMLRSRAELPGPGPSRMSPPVDGPATSPFGMRLHPILKVWRMHTGIDFGASTGAEVRAAAGGKVIFAGPFGAYGNIVAIDHGGGIATVYAHLQVWLVSQGQEVREGQAVGLADSTGMSTGPHLHFEVRRDGIAEDPAGWLR